MKRYLIILLFLLVGCSPKINKNLEANNNFNQHWNSVLDLFGSHNKSNQFYSISKALENYPTDNTDEVTYDPEGKVIDDKTIKKNR